MQTSSRTLQFCSRAARGRVRVATRYYSQQSPQTNGTQSNDSPKTSFGFKTVTEEEKESLVKNVFDSVASSYDLMNDAMSMGVHRLWKDTFVTTLEPGRRGPVKCIDVAGGTGDIAMRILDYARETYADRESTVDVVDINRRMLKEGLRRFKKTMYHNTPQIAFHEANAQALPEAQFGSDIYDLYTIAFGIRNCSSIPAVLREAHRVLKPGGTFACLEFSHVKNPILSSVYDHYSFSVIPLLGTILSGDRESYQYLVESIRKFPGPKEFAAMIRDAGFMAGGDFEGSAWTSLWGGMACIHRAVKLPN